MISAWNLLWIVPIVSFLSFFAASMCFASSQNEQLIDAYNAGVRDGRVYKDKETEDGSKT